MIFASVGGTLVNAVSSAATGSIANKEIKLK
jgi:hypothetical protein